MSQIDVILKYASRAAGIADLGPYVFTADGGLSDFARDRIIPNVRAWRASQDVAGVDPDGNPTVTHNYLAGYFVLVSLPKVVPALRDNAAVQLVIDRDLANARQAGAVIRSTVGAAILQDIRFEPLFAGSDYPWGNWQ